MKQSEKVAIVRLLTDVIKSDRIIDTKEIELFGKICDEYNINGKITLVEAQHITLAEAVQVVTEFPQEERLKLIQNIERLTIADGRCEQSEALLLLSLRYVLESNGSDVIDCSMAELDNIAPNTVFYVESDYDEDTNNRIKANYRTIENEFNLVGFEFVYFPVRSLEYAQIEEVKMKSIIGHIAPSLAMADIQSVYDEICNLTTKDFCRSLLYNKLGLKSLYDTEPSFLVKIGDSRVAFKPIHNYLKFMIGGDVLDDVRYFVDCYKHIVKEEGLGVHRLCHGQGRFEYSGFNKSVFDLMAFPGNKFESRILIDVNKHRISFEDINAELELSAYERALYVFLLYTDVMQVVVRRNESSQVRLGKLNDVFNKIYNMIGKWENETLKSYNTSNLPISLSRIKKQINKLELLDNKQLYIPETIDDVLSVKVDPNKVYVVDSITGKKSLMKDSDVWRNL